MHKRIITVNFRINKYFNLSRVPEQKHSYKNSTHTRNTDTSKSDEMLQLEKKVNAEHYSEQENDWKKIRVNTQTRSRLSQFL